MENERPDGNDASTDLPSRMPARTPEPAEGTAGIDRRDFLKRTGRGAGVLAVGGPVSAALASCRMSETAGVAAPAIRPSGAAPDVVVVGAGAFGGWTALHLAEMGAHVTLVDLYGPGNSRATSGGETRGVRTGYPGRDLWTSWASRAIEKWREFDEEWSPVFGANVFYQTGDIALREEWAGFLENTAETWDRNGVRYEALDPDEVAYRWPQIRVEGFGAGLYEPDAGVVRARVACHRVAEIVRRKGGTLRIGGARPGRRDGSRLVDVEVDGGGRIAAQRFVFALGPWFPKAFPELMAERMRVSTLGHVFYFGTPPGDRRFEYPNLPSYNFPGVTGWASLPPDNRGFRIRAGGSSQEDPDTSRRWIPEDGFEAPLNVVRERFPALAEQPIVETRACHYESSVTRDWFVDLHPEFENVWFAGGGSAEGFKFGPLVGELVAGRVLDRGLHPELDGEFRLGEIEPA